MQVPDRFRKWVVGVVGFLLLIIVGELPIIGASRAVKWLFAGDLVGRGIVFAAALLMAVAVGLTIWLLRRNSGLTLQHRTAVRLLRNFLVALLMGVAVFYLLKPGHWAVHPHLGHGTLLVVEWLIAASLVAFGGYFVLSLPTIWLLEGGAELERKFNARDRLIQLTLDRGGDLLFVVVSLIGGSWPVAWWYASRHDPRARLRAFIAAWLLALLNSAVWVGLMDTRIGWWIISLLAIPLIAWLPFVAVIYLKEHRR